MTASVAGARRHHQLVPALTIGKASTWIPLENPSLLERHISEAQLVVPSSPDPERSYDAQSVSTGPVDITSRPAGLSNGGDSSLADHCCKLVPNRSSTSGSILEGPLRAVSKLGIIKMGSEHRPHVVFVAANAADDSRKAVFVVPVDKVSATVCPPPDSPPQPQRQECHVEHAALGSPSPPSSPTKRSASTTATCGKRTKADTSIGQESSTAAAADGLWQTMVNVDSARKAIVAREMRETHAASGGDVVKLCNLLYSTNFCLQNPLSFDRYQNTIRKIYAYGDHRAAVYDTFLQETAFITLNAIQNDLFHTLHGIFQRINRLHAHQQQPRQTSPERSQMG